MSEMSELKEQNRLLKDSFTALQVQHSRLQHYILSLQGQVSKGVISARSLNSLSVPSFAARDFTSCALDNGIDVGRHLLPFARRHHQGQVGLSDWAK